MNRLKFLIILFFPLSLYAQYDWAYVWGINGDKVAFTKLPHISWRITSNKKVCNALDYFGINPNPYSDYGKQIFKNLYDSICLKPSYCTDVNKSLPQIENHPIPTPIRKTYPVIVIENFMVRLKIINSKWIL